MRLCSICDKELSGKWCKNCHRFVKSYEIGKGVHFNVSHDLENDAGCTYHTGGTDANVTPETSSKVSQTYNTRTAGNGSARPVTKKKSKVLILLLVFYVIFILIRVIVGLFSGVVHGLTDEIPKQIRDSLISEKDTDLRETGDMEYVFSPDLDKKLEALKAFDVVKSYEGDEYSFYYYNPEDIATLDFPCDESHFTCTVSDFETWLTETWPDIYETESNVDVYRNYFYDKEEYSKVSFSCERKYSDGDDFSVQIFYDTVTEQLHRITITSTSKETCMDWSFSFMQEFDTKAAWTKDVFEKNMTTGFDTESYCTVYGTENLTIQVYQDKDKSLVYFYPGYN